jgi:hypothetical protein
MKGMTGALIAGVEARAGMSFGTRSRDKLPG